MEEEQVVRQVETRLRSDYRLMLPFLAALDAAGRTDAADPVLARRMLDAGLEGLEDLTTDRVTGGALASRQGPALERYFLRVIEHEDHARDHLGLPPPVVRLAPSHAPASQGTDPSIIAMLTAMREEQAATNARIAELTAAKAENQGPLFSDAADAYMARLREANGEDDEEIRYLRHRKAIFITLCGDKPVASYTRDDLQKFVNEVRHLPPNISKRRDYDIRQTLTYIAEAKEAGTPGLSEATLRNTYLSRVRTILKDGCTGARIPFPLENVVTPLPKDVRKPKVRLTPDAEALDRVFRAGLETGSLVEAMMPLLGYLTGRRIGLLTYLQREDIHRYHGSWVIKPRDTVVKDGQVERVPIKTSESREPFVLHDFLDDIGFIAWAQRGSGFLFKSLHAALDPADTASKRMARLFRSAGVDPDVFKMFHGLRHAHIDRGRELKLEPRIARKQVGHETSDVHEGYGVQGMNRTETRTVASIPLLEDLDLSMFHGLDFEALAAVRPKRGRPRKDG